MFWKRWPNGPLMWYKLQLKKNAIITPQKNTFFFFFSTKTSLSSLFLSLFDSFRGRLVTLSKTQCSVFKHWTLVSKILKNAFGQPTVFWVVWKWLLQKPYLNSVFWNQVGADFKTTKLFSSGTLVIKVRFERAHLVSFFGRLSPLFTLVSSHAPKITQLQRSHQLQWTRNSPPTSITPFT